MSQRCSSYCRFLRPSIASLLFPSAPPLRLAAVRASIKRPGIRIELPRIGGTRVQDDFPTDVLQHGTVASRREYLYSEYAFVLRRRCNVVCQQGMGGVRTALNRDSMRE